MIATQRSAGIAAVLLAMLVLVQAPSARAAENAKADDVARFLAGLEPAAESPLTPLTREAGWQQHAKSLNAAWTKLEKDRLSRIRAWSGEHVKEPQPTVLYMFSGPDFLHVDAFFPDRSTYVMSGLEPVGQVPVVSTSGRRYLPLALAELRASVGTALNYSFFITQDMRNRLNDNGFRGVVPILYLFLARAGKTIQETTLIGIGTDGAVVAAGTRDAAPGVKIVFAGKDGRVQTLYYVQTDVSDHGLKRSGFLKFCEQFGKADVFIKSASYLLHSDSFGRIRSLLLDQGAALVQDDSGIPVRYFKAEDWRLQPFGRYLGPISVFTGRYQRGLSDVYRKSNPTPLTFGVGYRWRPHESNLLLATRAVAK
jgi:hypothetical protein